MDIKYSWIVTGTNKMCEKKETIANDHIGLNYFIVGLENCGLTCEITEIWKKPTILPSPLVNLK